LIAADVSPDPGAAARCVTGALKEGLLILAGGSHGNAISLSPPFDISPQESEFLADAIGRIL
jgi:4-aminobutyrate aminotransferase-like enzyme